MSARPEGRHGELLVCPGHDAGHDAEHVAQEVHGSALPAHADQHGPDGRPQPAVAVQTPKRREVASTPKLRDRQRHRPQPRLQVALPVRDAGEKARWRVDRAMSPGGRPIAGGQAADGSRTGGGEGSDDRPRRCSSRRTT